MTDRWTWTREGTKSGPANTCTTSTGVRYEVRQVAPGCWQVRRQGVLMEQTKTMREARAWVQRNVVALYAGVRL